MEIQIPAPKNRNLYLAKQVNQDSMNELSKAIIDINDSDEFLAAFAELHEMSYTPKPIKLYIDSYGGYAYQCLGLLGIMEQSAVPIHTIVTGCAMSCGFLISVAGHKRFAYDKATLMYHQVSSGAWGKLKEMEEDIMETKRLQKLIEAHTIAKTKLTKKQLKENFNGKKDWFMTSKEALKYGVIDEII